jgi:hypothetical protein
MIANARRHGQGNAQRLMDASEIVKHEMKSNGMGAIFDFL